MLQIKSVQFHFFSNQAFCSFSQKRTKKSASTAFVQILRRVTESHDRRLSRSSAAIFQKPLDLDVFVKFTFGSHWQTHNVFTDGQMIWGMCPLKLNQVKKKNNNKLQGYVSTKTTGRDVWDTKSNYGQKHRGVYIDANYRLKGCDVLRLHKVYKCGRGTYPLKVQEVTNLD